MIASLKCQYAELLSDIGFIKADLTARKMGRLAPRTGDGVLAATGELVSHKGGLGSVAGLNTRSRVGVFDEMSRSVRVIPGSNENTNWRLESFYHDNSKVCGFFRSLYLLHVFPCLVPVLCFPVLGTGCMFAFGTGCIFSCAWHWLHVLPHFKPTACFPALGTRCSASRAWNRRWHVFPQPF